MGDYVSFKSYFPSFWPREDYRWLYHNHDMIHTAIMGNPDWWCRSSSDICIAGTYIADRGYIYINDWQKFMNAWMAAVISRWMNRYGCYHWRGDKNFDISPGMLCKPDEYMGIEYYLVGCTMPKEFIYNILKSEYDLSIYISRRRRRKNIYKFMRPRRKADEAWWRNEKNWHGFDMGLFLDIYVHSFPKVTKDAYRDKWDIRRHMIDNKEIPVSSYLHIYPEVAEMYRDLPTHPLILDHRAPLEDRYAEIRERINSYRAASEKQRAYAHAGGVQTQATQIRDL